MDVAHFSNLEYGFQFNNSYSDLRSFVYNCKTQILNFVWFRFADVKRLLGIIRGYILPGGVFAPIVRRSEICHLVQG